jgi:DNA-binding response OmpR family regulator
VYKPTSVLIVEPDADTRLLYRVSLRDLNADIEEASDGAQALAKALVKSPDVVLTELRLPRLDGFALCSLLRSDEKTRNAGLVVVTGQSGGDVITTAQSQGADVVLLKPCAPDTLAAAITSLLRTRSRKQAGEVTADAASPLRPRPRIMSKACVRGVTTTPPTPPPVLHCPQCDGDLEYQHTHLGGVNARFAERWDYFVCVRCGVFQYRHRTRKLRAVPADERTA